MNDTQYYEDVLRKITAENGPAVKLRTAGVLGGQDDIISVDLDHYVKNYTRKGPLTLVLPLRKLAR